METRGRGGVEEGRRGKTGVSDESEDDICDYEKKRLQNIRKNHSMLRSLGQFITYFYMYIIIHCGFECSFFSEIS